MVKRNIVTVETRRVKIHKFFSKRVTITITIIQIILMITVTVRRNFRTQLN